MSGEPHGAHDYAPEGLAGEVLDELIERAYAEVADAPRWSEVAVHMEWPVTPQVRLSLGSGSRMGLASHVASTGTVRVRRRRALRRCFPGSA